MPNELLEIYLTDHCAAAAAGSRRMRRLADAERRSADGSTLERVANEIDEDRTTLQSIMKAEGIEPRWYKSAMARVGEAIGTLKTNGELFHRSPLTSLVELAGDPHPHHFQLDEAHTRRATVLAGAPQPTP